MSSDTKSEIPEDEKSPSVTKQRSVPDAKGNIYYLLTNNSFFRFNAAELDNRKESINNPKLSLSSVMKNILETSDVVGSTDSKADGIKYVSSTEKKLDPKRYPLKFKFKGNTYGSLRIALTSRTSNSDENELLKSETVINSPGLYYRH
jgi:hypothetical protein